MINKNYLTKYKKNGWVKIKNFFSSAEIDKINNHINLFLAKNLSKYKNRDINFSQEASVAQINSFHRLSDSDWIKNLGKQQKIKKLSNLFLETKKSKLRACELFAKPAKIGLASPIHQDNFYWCVKDNSGLTIWVALENSNKKNGAIFYYDGSHKLGLVDHQPSYMKGSSQKIKNIKILKKFKVSTPILKKGDCLIHHCLVIHGSNQNKSNNSRRGFTFQYIDFESRYDLKRKKEYERSLKLQIKKRAS